MPADVGSLRIDRSQEGNDGSRSWGRPLIGGALVVAAVAIGVGASGALPGLQDRLSSATSTAPRVRIAKASADAVGPPPGSYTQGGYLKADRIATVDPKASGRVVEIAVQEGQLVSEGDVLYKLDDRTERARLAVAEAALALAEFEAQQAAKLETVLGGEERRRRALRLDQTRADIELVRTFLDDRRVLAPFSGTVVVQNIDLGEMLHPSPPFGIDPRNQLERSITVADLRRLHVEVDIPEKDRARIHIGQPAQVSPDADKTRTYTARVEQITSILDRRKGTVLIKVRLLEPDDFLLPDMSTMVRFLADDTPPPSGPPPLTIPLAAVLRGSDGGTSVFVVQGGQAERRVVRLGPERGDRVVVEEGLAPGERVITGGDWPAGPGPVLVEGD